MFNCLTEILVDFVLKQSSKVSVFKGMCVCFVLLQTFAKYSCKFHSSLA